MLNLKYFFIALLASVSATDLAFFYSTSIYVSRFIREFMTIFAFRSIFVRWQIRFLIFANTALSIPFRIYDGIFNRISVIINTFRFISNRTQYFINTLGFRFRANNAYASPLFIDSNIVSGQRVSTNAMSFSFMNRRRTYSSHDIFIGSNRFQVVWVYARRIATQMIQLKSFWDGALMKFIRETMGEYSFASMKGHSIALGFAGHPNPAGFRFFNFIPKSLLESF